MTELDTALPGERSLRHFAREAMHRGRFHQLTDALYLAPCVETAARANHMRKLGLTAIRTDAPRGRCERPVRSTSAAALGLGGLFLWDRHSGRSSTFWQRETIASYEIRRAVSHLTANPGSTPYERESLSSSRAAQRGSPASAVQPQVSVLRLVPH